MVPYAKFAVLLASLVLSVSAESTSTALTTSASSAATSATETVTATVIAKETGKPIDTAQMVVATKTISLGTETITRSTNLAARQSGGKISVLVPEGYTLGDENGPFVHYIDVGGPVSFQFMHLNVTGSTDESDRYVCAFWPVPKYELVRDGNFRMPRPNELVEERTLERGGVGMRCSKGNAELEQIQS